MVNPSEGLKPQISNSLAKWLAVRRMVNPSEGLKHPTSHGYVHPYPVRRMVNPSEGLKLEYGAHRSDQV